MRSGEDELWKDAGFSCGPYELQCLFECASAVFTALHAAPGNTGRTGGRRDRRAAVKGRCCVFVSGMSEGGRAEISRGRRVLCEGSGRSWLRRRVTDTMLASAGPLVGAGSGCEYGTNAAACRHFALLSKEKFLFSAMKGSFWCLFPLKALDCL